MESTLNPVNTSTSDAQENDCIIQSPHKPARGERFAMTTANHSAVFSLLTPCATRLYEWLQQSHIAGMAFNIRLKEFEEFVRDNFPRTYSLRHIRRAWNQLIEAGLVSVLETFTGLVHRCKVHHVGKVEPRVRNVTNGSEMSRMGQKCPDQGTQTRMAPLPITEIKKEQQNAAANQAMFSEPDLKQETVASTPTVSEDCCTPINPGEASQVQNAGYSTTHQSTEEDKFSAGVGAEILRNVKDAVGELNPQLMGIMRSASLGVIKDALETLLERQERGTVSNPVGFLVEAIRNGWKPSQESQRNVKGFGQWFDKARAAGLVVASQMRDGIIYCLTANDTWLPWEDLRSQDLVI